MRQRSTLRCTRRDESNSHETQVPYPQVHPDDPSMGIRCDGKGLVDSRIRRSSGLIVSASCQIPLKTQSAQTFVRRKWAEANQYQTLITYRKWRTTVLYHIIRSSRKAEIEQSSEHNIEARILRIRNHQCAYKCGYTTHSNTSYA